MDPRLLDYYNRELAYLREMGAEFAAEFPKVAARLDLSASEGADPYVERLIEGCAFLAARVQLKVDAEFPRFSQHLLHMVYPDYLSPVPSMAVVQFTPQRAEGALLGGFALARGTVLRSQTGRGEQTPCEFRTAQDVVLWPLEVAAAEYIATPGGLAALGVDPPRGTRAALRVVLKTWAGLRFDQLALDDLPVYLRGDDVGTRLFELLHTARLGVLARPGERPPAWTHALPASAIAHTGFGDDEAILPQGPRGFSGHRLLREYFACPTARRAFAFTGLSGAVRRCAGDTLELFVPLARADAALERAVEASHLALYCTPAVNLFPRRGDRIHLSEQQREFHVVADRTRPLDFEVYAVTQVTGYGAAGDTGQAFLPFYAVRDRAPQAGAYYTLTREPRLVSARARRTGPRSNYIGSEVFVALVDANEAPYHHALRQLGVDLLCTNRDLPLHMPVGKGDTDFTLVESAPVAAVRCVVGPTRPRPAAVERELSWHLLAQLTLNHLSLLDNDEVQGAVALRELLALYADPADSGARRQVDGVQRVASRPVVRRIPLPGPVTFGRGVEITLTLDEHAFEGTGPLLLGLVLGEYFTRAVTINAFTETVLRGAERGELLRGSARLGRRDVV